MNEREFRNVYLELIEENPFAVRAALKVLSVEFTDRVATLAVSCEERPLLRVNLGFLTDHCRDDQEVKAVIVHEFLHVLLRHTDSTKPVTPARHLATDAVINAIIHRTLGEDYSGFMSRYYRDEEGVRRLLRRPRSHEEARINHWKRRDPSAVESAWLALYRGQLCADDIEEIARDLEGDPSTAAERLIGGHDEDAWQGADPGLSSEADDLLSEALDRTLRAYDGEGVWRNEHGRGVRAELRDGAAAASEARVDRWSRKTFEILKRCVDPEVDGALCEEEPFEYRLPVLSPGDRRAALRATWSPFLPEATWRSGREKRIGGAQVYLDVSGSMSAEMPHLVKLLGQLSRFIKRPFWAFSNEVAPAWIEDGVLRSQTTGGTSIACVLEHVAETRPPTAIIVTDGYIESVPRELLEKASRTRLHSIVTRNGSTTLLDAARIPTTQLEELPQ